MFFDASVVGVIDVYWSEEVIAEYLKHGPRVHREIAKSKGNQVSLKKCKDHIEKKIELYRQHSGFIVVNSYETISINEKAIKDKNDIHVYKAAKKAQCNVLVTNDKGFKNIHSVTDLNIVAQKADEFFCNLYYVEPSVIKDIVNRTKLGIENQRKVSIDFEDFLDEMRKGKLPQLASLLS